MRGVVIHSALVVCFVLVLGSFGFAAKGPSVGGNVLVDLDRDQAFPKNKQNEPAITRDPLTGTLVVGANDELDEPLCSGTTVPLTSPCPFKKGVPISFFYRSTDNGRTWTGGALPGFDAIGRTSGGDPSLDFGPRQCAGTFSFGCGSVIYYASLGDPFPERGGEIATVSRSYDAGLTWFNPVIATSTDRFSNFVDHEWIAVDHSPSSPNFGRVYLFWAVFCNNCLGNGNVKLYVAHSDDEAQTWSKAVQVSDANNNTPQGFRETGEMAVSSDGTVEVFWTENADSPKIPSLQVVAVSKDGGETFMPPIVIAEVLDYPLRGTPFDVVDLFNRVPGMSARVDCFPHPAADPASSKVYVVWCDFDGVQGVVKAAVSVDGFQWTQLGTVAQVSGRNAFFPQASVAPSGLVALIFLALTQPPANDPFQTGVQVYDAYYAQLAPGASAFTNPILVSTQSSNPDSSSYNNLMEQFIGDYIGIIAGSTGAVAVWTDVRNGVVCGEVDAYRNALYAGSRTAVAPNPDRECGIGFGNTDNFASRIDY